MLRILHLFIFLFATWTTGSLNDSDNWIDDSVAEIFEFEYLGPDYITVDENCREILHWGHPSSVKVEYNGSGQLTYFSIESISGGYQMGDYVTGGETVTITYLAKDDKGNTAEFSFNIDFVDEMGPVFDPVSNPSVLIVQCIDHIPAAHEILVSDNCDPDGEQVTVTISGGPAAPACDAQEFTRTLTATDIYGNKTILIQEVIVEADTEAPIITVYPDNQVANCEELALKYHSWLSNQLYRFRAVDEGCGDISYSYIAPPLSEIQDSTCTTIIATFIAEDKCGNQTSTEATFTIQDHTAPTFIESPHDLTVNCSDENAGVMIQDWLNSNGGAIAQDNCSDITWSRNPEIIDFSKACEQALKINFIASDKCGNRAISTAYLKIESSGPPEILEQPEVVITDCNVDGLEDEFRGFLTAGSGIQLGDYCSAYLGVDYRYIVNQDTISQEGLVAAFLDSSDGNCRELEIDGIEYKNVIASIFYKTIIANVCGGESTSEIIHYVVVDTIFPLIVTRGSDLTVYCEDIDSVLVLFDEWYASAAGAEIIDYCGTYTTKSIPSYNVLREMLTENNYDCNTGLPALFIFTDNCGNTTMDTLPLFFTVLDTMPPYITEEPQDITVACTESYDSIFHDWIDNYAFANVEDDCSEPIWLNYAWVNTGGGYESFNFDGINYPDYSPRSCRDSLEITFYFSDHCQNIDSFAAYFHVIDTVPPQIVNFIDTLYVDCTEIPAAQDLEIIKSCNYEMDIVIVDEIIREGDPSECTYYEYSILRKYYISNDCGFSDSLVQFIQLSDNSAPDFVVPEDVSVQCGYELDFELTGEPYDIHDACGSPVSMTYRDSLISDGCPRVIERKWTATDICMNEGSQIQLITIIDTIAPFYIDQPEDIAVGCSENIALALNDWIQIQLEKEAEDDCQLQGRFAATPGSYNPWDPASFPGLYPGWDESNICSLSNGDTIARVDVDFVIYDQCFNTRIINKGFFLIDTIPPQIINCPSDTILYTLEENCGNLYDLPQLQYFDECSDEIEDGTLIVNGDTLNYHPDSTYRFMLLKGVNLLSFLAEDCAGNIADCSWTVEVVDATPPVLTCDFKDVYLIESSNCTTIIKIDDYSAHDNCDLNNVDKEYVIITADGDTITGLLPQNQFVSLGLGKHSIEITATDKSGNSSTCSGILNVEDGILPVAVCKPAFIKVYPDGLPVEVDPADFDLGSSANCGIDSIWINHTSFDCSQAGQAVEVKLYVRNLSGKIDSCTTTGQIEYAPLNPSFTMDLCYPDTLELFANIPGGDKSQYLYTWTGPRGFSSSLENPILINIDSSYSGTYTLEIRGPSGCTLMGSVDVNIRQMGEPHLFLSAGSICEGESVILESNSYSGPVTYSWYEGTPPFGVLIGTSESPFFEITPVLGIHPYYVIVSNNICTTDPSRIRSVEVVDLPIAQVEKAFINVCEGEKIQLGSIDHLPGITYLWQGPNGFLSTEKSPVVSESSTLVHQGLYTLTVALGDCVSDAVTVEVDVTPSPETPVLEGESIICFGGSVRLSTDNSRQYDSYIWENSQGLYFVTDVPILLLNNANNTHKGDWTLKVSDGICSSIPSEAFFVDVKPVPEVEVDAPETVCEGGDIFLSASGTGVFEYRWINPQEDTLWGDEVMFSALEGLYILEAESYYGCVYSESMYIGLVQKPTVTALSSTAPDCIESLADITFEPTVYPADDGSYTYQWIYDDEIIGVDSILRLTSASIKDTGIYYLIVEVGDCLSDTFQYNLNMKQTPDRPSFLNRDFFCESDSVILLIDEYSGDEVKYYFRVGNTDYPENSPRLNLGILSRGSYTVSVQVMVDGCISRRSNLVEITVGDIPEQNTISGNNSICQGDLIELMASGTAGSFVWYHNGDSLTTTDVPTLIIPNAGNQNSGSYTVKQTVGECESFISNEFILQVNKTPGKPEIEHILDGICISKASEELEICLGGSTFETTADYNWYHLATNEMIGSFSSNNCHVITDFSSFTDGENLLYLTADIDGCYGENSDTIAVMVSRAPEEIAEGGMDIYVCSGEIPTLNATAGVEGMGMWQVLSDTTELSSYTDPQAQVTRMKVGENILVWSLSYGSCEDFSTDTIYVYYDLPPIAVDDEYIKPFGSTFSMDVLKNDDIIGGVILTIEEDVKNGRTILGSSTIQYAPYNGFVGEDSLVYKICSASCPDACSTANVHITIGDDSLCDIPTIFTPNDDGTNDYFIIQCLSSGKYPDNTLKVFNQYGDQVFYASPYQNDWKGTYKGQQLPAGTYYFIMDMGDGRAIQKGFVVIEY